MKLTVGKKRMVWAAWVLTGLVYEAVMIFNHEPGDTLSETVWWLYAIPSWGNFLTWVIGGGLLWLLVHFTSRGKYG